MAKGTVNKVIIIGRLGKDPEVRYTGAGKAMCTLSIATDENTKDPQSGEWISQTEWHRVVLFDRTAEVAKEYTRKGSKVYIEGRIRTRKWTDKDNNERYTTEIFANTLEMLDSKNSGMGEEHGAPDFGQPTERSAPPRPQSKPSHGGHDDDDAPF